eukprot:GHVR01082596.1.p1 GENE.GHVR01082596.1~~GHVR01082596.1.p1  ORF type:complete len:217 (-),score=36.92 GHVR01082596.1:75-725(-)
MFTALLAFPQHFFLNRGNHETVNMNKVYGFYGEISAKYEVQLYNLFTEAFRWLPLAHVLNKRVFVTHGGLFSRDDVTLEELEALDRDREPPDEGCFVEMLWSDPQFEKGRAPSKRGIGVSFGPDVTEAFLNKNCLDCVVRSHEMKQNGYEIEHNGKLTTVFSAPNYCDQMGNKGAFIRYKAMSGGRLDPKYTTFSHSEKPVDAKPMQYASPVFGYI